MLPNSVKYEPNTVFINESKGQIGPPHILELDLLGQACLAFSEGRLALTPPKIAAYYAYLDTMTYFHRYGPPTTCIFAPKIVPQFLGTLNTKQINLPRRDLNPHPLGQMAMRPLHQNRPGGDDDLCKIFTFLFMFDIFCLILGFLNFIFIFKFRHR